MTSGSHEEPGQRPAPRVANAGGRKVTGAKHVRDHRPCQDAIHVFQNERVVLVALADGHGSSVNAEAGARLAVEVASAALKKFVDGLGPDDRKNPRKVYAFAQDPFRIHVTREWVQRVHEASGCDDVDLRDYGSTLLFAAVTPEFVLIGQLGDGDILVVDGSGTVSRPIPADPSSFAEETLSLCLPEASISLRVLVFPHPIEEMLLLLSTDGYAKSYATDHDFERIGPDYLRMVRELGVAGVEGHLEEFLTAVTQGGSGDDIALGIIYIPGRASVAPGASLESYEASPPNASSVPSAKATVSIVSEPSPTANNDHREEQ